jgi:hypothetical protein
MVISRFVPAAAAATTLIRKALAVVASGAVVTTGLVVTSATPAMASSGWYITNILSGRCIAPVNNNTADRNIIVVLSNAPCRITWSINDRAGSDFKIISLDANSARCLVPSGSSQSDGVAIVTGACSTTPPFWWREIPVGRSGGHDYFEWQSAISNDCLTVKGNGTSAGSIIAQEPCTGAPTQWFTWHA